MSTLAQIRRFCTSSGACRTFRPVNFLSHPQRLYITPQHLHRRFASASSSIEEEDSKNLKPKASTPLRRAASASLPIRSNPTPTRSTIQPVFTLTTATRYVLPRIRGSLPQSSRHLHDALWVPTWGVDGKVGEVFIFSNGSFVTWGLGEEEARMFAAEVLSKSGTEVEPLVEAETEDLEFVTDPSEYVSCISISRFCNTERHLS